MRKCHGFLAAVVALVMASTGAAAPLAPGAFHSPPDVFTLTSGAVGGGSITLDDGSSSTVMTLVDSMASPFGGPSDKYSGTLYSMVYADITGALSFFYQLSVNPTPALSSPDDLAVDGYLGVATDVGRLDDPGLLDWMIVNRDVPGDTISGGTFSHLPPGSTSEWLVIRTSSTSYGAAMAHIQDGQNFDVASFCPAPLPSAFVLFATGALGLAGGCLGRLRRKPA